MSAFIDTNIFVYSVSVAPEDATKRGAALTLLGVEERRLLRLRLRHPLGVLDGEARRCEGVDHQLVVIHDYVDI